MFHFQFFITFNYTALYIIISKINSYFNEGMQIGSDRYIGPPVNQINFDYKLETFPFPPRWLCEKKSKSFLHL